MNTIELENIIKKYIYLKIVKYENKRKILFFKIYFTWLVLIILAPIVFFIKIFDLQILIWFILIFINIFFSWFIKNIIIKLDDFYIEMKKDIINTLISIYNSSISYQIDKYLGSKVFKASQILKSNVSKTKGHDLIKLETFRDDIELIADLLSFRTNNV